MYESSTISCHPGPVPFSERCRMFELLPGTATNSSNKDFRQYVFGDLGARYNVNHHFSA